MLQFYQKDLRKLVGNVSRFVLHERTSLCVIVRMDSHWDETGDPVNVSRLFHTNDRSSYIYVNDYRVCLSLSTGSLF